MADYIFNIYLHTDKGEFSDDYSLSEYTFSLPPFYFSPNEFVSARATVEATNSILSCRGSNIFNAQANLGGLSMQETLAVLSTYVNASGTYMTMGSKALVPATAVRYTDILGTAWLICCGIYHYDIP
jgi:hypothetical protein